MASMSMVCNTNTQEEVVIVLTAMEISPNANDGYSNFNPYAAVSTTYEQVYASVTPELPSVSTAK